MMESCAASHYFAKLLIMNAHHHFPPYCGPKVLPFHVIVEVQVFVLEKQMVQIQWPHVLRVSPVL
jgi:hypothetical protein